MACEGYTYARHFVASKVLIFKSCYRLFAISELFIPGNMVYFKMGQIKGNKGPSDERV